MERKTSAALVLVALSLQVLTAARAADHRRPEGERPRPARPNEVLIAFKRRCHQYTECDWAGNGVFGLRRRAPRLVRLTSDPSDRDPAWSPDGKRLAFARCDPGDCDVWTLDLATSKETRVTRGPGVDGEPTWSPDGTRLAFHRCAPGRAARNSCDLWTVGVDGTAAARLTHNDVADGHPDWSWKYDKIVFDRGDCPRGTTSCRRSAIFVMAADGGRQRPLARPPQGAWEPRWDRTRRRVAYDSCGGFCTGIRVKGSPLRVLDLRRGTRVVYTETELSFTPSFSRHGRRLLFAVLSGDNGAVIDRGLRTGPDDVFYSDYEYDPYAPDWRPQLRG